MTNFRYLEHKIGITLDMGMPGSPALVKRVQWLVRLFQFLGAFHSCPHVTVTWSPWEGGMRQYILVQVPYTS